MERSSGPACAGAAAAVSPPGANGSPARRRRSIKYVICNARRGRPRRLHGPLDHGGQPAQRAGGHDHRRLRHRAPAGLHLRPRRSTRWRSSTSLAIAQAREYGLLGETSSAAGFDFDIESSRGGGAFVCGESTALMRLHRGQPRRAAPAATSTVSEKGLWGRPTNINNVETWANVPHHRSSGAEWFRAIGTRAQQGHEGLLARRQGEQYRAGRSADGDDPAGDHLRHRRRYPRAASNSRPSRPAAPPAAASRRSLLDLPVDFDEPDARPAP